LSHTTVSKSGISQETHLSVLRIAASQKHILNNSNHENYFVENASTVLVPRNVGKEVSFEKKHSNQD